jgi:hypothetical protein
LANGNAGTSEQGTVTLTLPQDIHTAATPTFGAMTLTRALPSAYNALDVINTDATGFARVNLTANSLQAGFNWAPANFLKAVIPNTAPFLVELNGVTRMTVTTAGINGTDVGVSAAGQGIFTTGGYSGSQNNGMGGTGTNTASITLAGGSGSAGGGLITFTRNSTNAIFLGNYAPVLGGTSNDGLWYAGAGQSLFFFADGAEKLRLVPAGAIVGGSIQTADPSGSTARPWLLGDVNAVSPTAPNRTVAISVNGTVLYLHAKTTND